MKCRKKINLRQIWYLHLLLIMHKINFEIDFERLLRHYIVRPPRKSTVEYCFVAFAADLSQAKAKV